MAQHCKDFFRESFEMISAWCLNLMGLFLKSSRYGAELQKTFSRGSFEKGFSA